MSKRSLFLSLASLVAVGLGCGVATTPSPKPDAPAVSQTPKTCQPDTGWRNCTCANGVTSVQLCNTQGGGYDACKCSVPLGSGYDAGADAGAAPLCMVDGQFPDALKGVACSPSSGKGNGIFVCRANGGSIAPTCEPASLPPGPDANIVPDLGPDTVHDSLPAVPDSIIMGSEAGNDAFDLVSTSDTAPDLTDTANPQADATTGQADAAPDMSPEVGGSCGTENMILTGDCYDSATNRYGFRVCVNGMAKCVFYTPPSAASCDRYRNGEIDYYSACVWKDNCDNGMFVCRNGTWKCEAFLVSYYYAAPACMLQNDAGVGGSTGTGGNSGTGGNVGTGGTPGMGGALGTGGGIGTGGSSAGGGSVGTGGTQPPGTGGEVATGGNIGTGGLIGTGGSVSTGGFLATGGGGGSTSSDAGNDASSDAPQFVNGWPQIGCVNTGTTGAFIKVTLLGNIDGVDTMGTSNLVDLQSFNSGITIPSICLVGDTVGWYSRSYCANWTEHASSIVFPAFPVQVSGTTKMNYVIDYANGQMIWGRNANLSFAPGTGTEAERCAFSLADNLIVKPNGS